MGNSTGVFAELPSDLHYLIEPAMRYGRYQFDDDIFGFLNRATDSELNHLASIAQRVLLNSDFARVTRFLREHPITDSEEAARLYFLFGVMDYAGLEFERVANDAP